MESQNSITHKIISLILSQSSLPLTYDAAVTFMKLLGLHVCPTKRELKLIVLRILIYAKFKETGRLVPYRYLRGELAIKYQPELDGMLAQLANDDVANGFPPIDTLVAEEGSDLPSKGYFNSSVKGRKDLMTDQQKRHYHKELYLQLALILYVKPKPAKETRTLANGRVITGAPVDQYRKHNLAIPQHSGKRYHESNKPYHKAA